MDHTHNLQDQIDSQLPNLQGLIRQGGELRNALATGAPTPQTVEATRRWQAECGAVVNELSGGSKAHWLSRSYSEAFLMRSEAGAFVENVAPNEIVSRLLDVLNLALRSLTQMAEGGEAAAVAPAPPPRRFDFVHNRDLRPVLEAAYPEATLALEKGQFDLAMLTACGILEAIVTDALQAQGAERNAAPDDPEGPIDGWSFEGRLGAAERAGLIRGGWARLSAKARRYREEGPKAGDPKITEVDARTARQVLHVVLRDLNPGR